MAIALKTLIEFNIMEMKRNLMSLCRKFKVWPFNNGINWACLLTKSTIDALGHVNIIPARFDKLEQN